MAAALMSILSFGRRAGWLKQRLYGQITFTCGLNPSCNVRAATSKRTNTIVWGWAAPGISDEAHVQASRAR